MKESDKHRCAMIVELIVCIVMLIGFLYEPNKLFQFMNLFVALMSVGFMFDHRRKLMEIEGK